MWWIILRKGPGQTILNFTNKSSALGWLYKASFNPVTHASHSVVARHLARMVLENNATLYSQHIKGKKNVIADSLSRNMNLPDNIRLPLLTTTFPTQTPNTESLQHEDKDPTRRNTLVALLAQEDVSSQQGNAPGTRAKQLGCFGRYLWFCKGIGITDLFLDKQTDALNI